MSSQTVAVVVAHPDDEVLGFGGAIRRHSDAGDAVHVLILATGLAARKNDGEASPAAFETLRRQARRAGDILGVADIRFGDFPDNRMDTVPLLDVVRRVEAFLGETGATVLMTHHLGDLNVDHRIAARAALTAARPLPGARVWRALAGEVLSSTEYGAPLGPFRPTVYFDIADNLAAKCEALRCYRDEIRPWPHPRSAEAVEALARLRGAECGRTAAEAFELLREVRD